MSQVPPDCDAFERIVAAWQSIAPRPRGNHQALLFVQDLTATPPGLPEGPAESWLRACQHLVAGTARDPDERVIEEMWNEVADARLDGGHSGGNNLWQAASIMLKCARVLRSGGPGPEGWRELASHFPLRTILDMVAELSPHLPGGLPPTQAASGGGGGRRILQLPAVLVRTIVGLPATLELELLDSERAEFCPAFEMVLEGWDGELAGSLNDARAFLAKRDLWPRRCDVRWKLTFLDGTRRSLRGGSLGGALAFGTAWLAALHGLVPPSPIVHRLRTVHHPQCLCFSGAISEDGLLHGVSGLGVGPKIQAARRDDRVAILILPKSALQAVEKLYLANRSTQSPTTFLRIRSEPKAPSLTIVCESQLFLP